ncbi:MAG: DUF6231 family protein [Pseudomonadales bacterium]
MSAAAPSKSELSPLQSLANIIHSLECRTVLLCSHSQLEGLGSLCAEMNCDLSVVLADQDQMPVIPMQRFDLVVVADYLEHHSQSEGATVIARLRNLHSNHIAVFQQDRAQGIWPESAFFALALKHQHRFEYADSNALHLYTYDIESYNHKRTWNNARFWANPENFGRYWW